MKKKKELKHLNKLFKKMQQQFTGFLETQSPEALHGFRVQVKKTRSFLTLLEAGSKSNKLLKIFNPVKIIFKQTGIIRDAQVHEKQAKENHINASQFYKEQDTLQQQETVKLLNRKNRLLHKVKKVKRRLQHNISTVSQTEIKEFFTRQIHNADQLLCSHNLSEQLHNGRKMLKHLLYNQKVVPASVAKNMHIDFNDIDAMQQLIGDWHDKKLAIDFFSKKLPSENLEPLKQKQEALKQKITAKANSFAQTNQ